MIEGGDMSQVLRSDIRLFRERAREERRRVRRAESERARIVHGEMAEHYELVADLLEAKAGQGFSWPAPGLRRILRGMLPR